MVPARVCLCVVLFMVIGAYGDGNVTIKGLYCKDPDDDTYHPVNSTWRSTTFCGNYTCKIRKKNNNKHFLETEQFISPTELIEDDLQSAGSEYYSVKDEPFHNDQNANHINVEKHIEDTKRNEAIRKFEDNIIANLGEKGDRYLNAAEINSITDLLHTVKKSELEGILEVYSLAKDIYSEIEETTSESLTEKENIKFPAQHSGAGKLSYFYDPYGISQVYAKRQRDIDVAASNTIASQYPIKPLDGPILKQYPEKLNEYPSSEFQRTSSYYYYPTKIQRATSTPTNAPQKPQSNGSCCLANGANPLVASYFSEWRAKPQFVPYPFAYSVRKRMDYPYDSYPWMYPYPNPLGYYHNLQMQNQIPQQPSPSNVNNHPVLQKGKIDFQTDIIDEIYGYPHRSSLLEKLVPTEKSNRPSWQTDQLSPEVIDDIRANVLQKTEKIINIIPRKKIKLERVAKVLKIDEVARSKRDVDVEVITSNINKQSEVKNNKTITEEAQKDMKAVDDNLTEEYEAYIEKETCGSTFEPGYFRVGNMSQPFPMCCPQKIDSTEKP